MMPKTLLSCLSSRTKYFIICIFLLGNGMTHIYGQELPVKHKVLKGETVDLIAKKYGVSAADLYRLNPNLINGVVENEVLIISKSTNNTVGEDFIYHLVRPNETKYGLSKKYGISIQELERQNPPIIHMLQTGQELKIRVKPLGNAVATDKLTDKSVAEVQYLNYLVQPGETLYGISKRYRISVAQLEDLNKDLLGRVLLSGQTLRVPSTKEQIKKEIQSEFQYYVVEAGETKYGLSKRFEISIGELEQLNPQIIPMLKKGDEIRFPKKSANNKVAAQKNTIIETSISKEKPVVKEQPPVKKDSEVTSKTQSTSIISQINMISYEVKPQETLYGLSRMTGLTQEKLIEINPELSNGVRIGMILNIPSDSKIIEQPVKPNVNKISEKGLLTTLQKNTTKNIAFLLPFSEDQYLDFLNLPTEESAYKKHFEFYAGATMAMDSLKTLNVLINSAIFKTNEMIPSEEDFSNLVDTNIKSYNVVFSSNENYNSDKLGSYLSKNNTPLIISNVKDSAKVASTTYLSVPSDFNLRKLILDYLASKKENLIIVNDPLRTENKGFITRNYPEAQFADFSENGSLNLESLKNLLSVTKKNYIVLDTDKAGLILTATTLLLKESTHYNVQIALLEPIEVLKEEGLSNMRFKALKMIYPSLTKPSSLKALSSFKSAFAKKFKFDANKDAITGFEVTFDVLVRLFQAKEFESLAKEQTTEQINFKFEYVKNVDGGYFNSGAYILQFDDISNKTIIN